MRDTPAPPPDPGRPSEPPTRSAAPRAWHAAPPADPAIWLDRTERLIERYRRQLRAQAGPDADPGLDCLWLAAERLFELHGQAADFSLLDVATLREGTSAPVARTVQLVTALSAFYTFLADANVVSRARAASIRAELATLLENAAL